MGRVLATVLALALAGVLAPKAATAQDGPDPVRAGVPVDGLFTYCVREDHLREMAEMESRLVRQGRDRRAFLERFGARKVAECHYAPFQDLTFVERAFSWRGFDRDGAVTDWEAWRVVTAEWGLRLYVVIERGWVVRGEPI